MKEKALEWIVALLDEGGIPFSLCGGLAANFYGADRPLNDIDLFVPAERFRDVVDAGAAHIAKPAQHYCEEAEGWDLEYVQFVYEGVKIEVGSDANVRIYDQSSSRWTLLSVDFDATVEGHILGSRVTVMSRADLIEYKSRLDREVDRQDIAALGKEMGSE